MNEIVRWFKQGKSERQIAEICNISRNKVRRILFTNKLILPKTDLEGKIECSKCHCKKDLGEFPNLHNNKKCRKCCKTYNRKYVIRKFDISELDYNLMYQKQNGCCFICGCKGNNSLTKHGDEVCLAIDHNHKTGKVRGLLCNKCNKGLGCFMDDSGLLQKAIDYLTKRDGSEYEKEDRKNQMPNLIV